MSTRIFDTLWLKTPCVSDNSIASSAEIFMTVIVSCTPSLWSFWFNIFTKSQLNSFLRSTIWNRQEAAPSKAYLGTSKNSHHVAGCCNCEPFQHPKVALDSLIEQSAEDLEPPFPTHAAKAMKKHTIISQHILRKDSDIEMQSNLDWSKLPRDSLQQCLTGDAGPSTASSNNLGREGSTCAGVSVSIIRGMYIH